jgi:hypothetical protein
VNVEIKVIEENAVKEDLEVKKENVGRRVNEENRVVMHLERFFGLVIRV